MNSVKYEDVIWGKRKSSVQGLGLLNQGKSCFTRISKMPAATSMSKENPKDWKIE